MRELPDGEVYVVSIMERFECQDSFYGNFVEHYCETIHIGHDKEIAIYRARLADKRTLFNWVDLDRYVDGILIEKIDFKEKE